MKLALGTAQFGMSYGVANQLGQVNNEQIIKILNVARKGGVSVLDTAIGYGDSEMLLGLAGVNDFKIVTKFPAFLSKEVSPSEWVNDQISQSLLRLRVNSVYGVLMHRPLQLLDAFLGPALLNAMHSLRKDNLTKKIGISIYSPGELDLIWPIFKPDIVQCPFNLIDRRLETSGWLSKLHDEGVEIHARSLFMQGLLVMPKGRIPKKFQEWDSVWNNWHDWLEVNKVSATKACLSFGDQTKGINHLVVGVDSSRQLLELIAHHKGDALINNWPQIESVDERLINPSLWSLF